MSAHKIYPVILSGGLGNRLWPLSQMNKPKQFHIFTNDEMMIDATLKRAKHDLFHPPTIIGLSTHQFLISETLRAHDFAIENDNALDILLEPEGKNTAAAVALAAKHFFTKDKDSLLLIMPADHIITKPEIFYHGLEQLTPWVTGGKIGTFGIVADSPHTGYGYIEADMGASLTTTIYPIKKFHEKPNRAQAENYLQAGNFYFNSGIFFCKASTVCAQFTTYAPEIWQKIEHAYANADRNDNIIKLRAQDYASIENLPFDKAIMEKSNDGIIMPIAMGWNDLGSWRNVYALAAKDQNQNHLRGNVIAQQTTNSLIINHGQGMIATVGIDNQIIICRDENLLIIDKDKSEQVKNITDDLRAQNQQQYLVDRQIYRPWGSFTIIDQGENYVTKRLMIKSGGILSLQYHEHRSENWVVVAGVAHVQLDGRKFELNVTESLYIPQKSIHRLENKSDAPLIIIEVQSGAILKEEDIIRLEDYYGRC